MTDEPVKFSGPISKLTALELTALRDEAIEKGDEKTRQACDAEFKKRYRTPLPPSNGTEV